MGVDGELVLGLELSSWGREDRMREVEPVPPALGACGPGLDPAGRCVRQLEYAREGVTEWWLGLGDGVEQGWTVEERPVGDGLLRFEVVIDEAVSLEAGGPAHGIVDGRGQRWTVDGVAAWDADGDPVPAAARFEGGLLVVEVDDAGARYPVTVDPVYTTAAWAATGDTAALFGCSVGGAGDVDGDTTTATATWTRA